MASSLLSSQECSPAEDLHSSRDDTSRGALGASRARKSDVWFMASWNVRTLLDADGLIETARHSSKMGVVDERKTDPSCGRACKIYTS